MIYEIKSLCFSYPSAKRTVLENVSLTLEEGEILTVLGPNGAGKSTLLKCMLGLLKAKSGSINLCGKSLQQMTEREISSAVSYVRQTQEAGFAYTVEDYVLMGCASNLGLFERPGKRERSAAAKALEEIGITELSERRITELSGGEKQQAAIARAIVSDPKCILFDEPTAHLDWGNQLRTLRMIKNLSAQGYALVITTHNPDHALLLGGKTAVIDRNGHLTCGKTQELLTEELLSDVYGAPLKLFSVEEAGRAVCIYPNL